MLFVIVHPSVLERRTNSSMKQQESKKYGRVERTINVQIALSMLMQITVNRLEEILSGLSHGTRPDFAG